MGNKFSSFLNSTKDQNLPSSTSTQFNSTQIEVEMVYISTLLPPQGGKVKKSHTHKWKKTRFLDLPIRIWVLWSFLLKDLKTPSMRNLDDGEKGKENKKRKRDEQ